VWTHRRFPYFVVFAREQWGDDVTTRSPNKKAARTLATLTGRPYQTCLSAVEVLRTVPSDFDIGELADFFADRPIDTSALSLCYEDLANIPAVWGPSGSSWMIDDDPFYVHADEDDDDDATVALRLSGHGLEMWPTIELWVQVPASNVHMRKGTWRIRHEELVKAVRIAAEAISPEGGALPAKGWEHVSVRGVRTPEPLFDFPKIEPDTCIVSVQVLGTPLGR
jgi:hypothetical protein